MAKTITLKNYKKFWISDTKNGHIIKICYGNNDNRLDIKCCWLNRIRGKDARPKEKKTK